MRFWLALVVFVLLLAMAVILDQVRRDASFLIPLLPSQRDTLVVAKLEHDLRAMTIGLAAIELVLLLSATMGARQFATRHRDDRRTVLESERFARATFDALPAQIA